jgi:preprotein translocase subunit SecG
VDDLRPPSEFDDAALAGFFNDIVTRFNFSCEEQQAITDFAHKQGGRIGDIESARAEEISSSATVDNFLRKFIGILTLLLVTFGAVVVQQISAQNTKEDAKEAKFKSTQEAHTKELAALRADITVISRINTTLAERIVAKDAEIKLLEERNDDLSNMRIGKLFNMAVEESETK